MPSPTLLFPAPSFVLLRLIFISSRCFPTGTCQPWQHQPAFPRWISITHCPCRCLPSRSRPPMPTTPCPSLPPYTTPTPWRTTSPYCADTRCACTTPGAKSPTGSSAAPIWTTAGAACPPAPTSWPRMKTTRPPRSTSPPESNQREAGLAEAAAGAGGDPDWTATWRPAGMRHLKTLGLGAA